MSFSVPQSLFVAFLRVVVAGGSVDLPLLDADAGIAMLKPGMVHRNGASRAVAVDCRLLGCEVDGV